MERLTCTGLVHEIQGVHRYAFQFHEIDEQGWQTLLLRK